MLKRNKQPNNPYVAPCCYLTPAEGKFERGHHLQSTINTTPNEDAWRRRSVEELSWV